MEEEVKADEIAEGVPDAFTEDVAELDGVNEGDETEVTVDFAELAEALKQLREGVEEETLNEEEEELEESNCSPATDEEPMDEELELDEESIMEMVASMLSEEEEEVEEGVLKGTPKNPVSRNPKSTSATTAAAKRKKELDKERQRKAAELERQKSFYGNFDRYGNKLEEGEDLYEELSDDMLDAIMEKLTVDMGATLSGWAGRSSEDMKHQMELELAHRRSTEVAEELEALKKAQEELVFENKKLKENLSNYQDVVNSLKENVQDVNLSNARLLYTNRTLRNSSLNERQKERIVEAISKAGSVEEAKTIHET
jgi:FtsZ-binding cell division protein ZapB